MYEEAKKSTTPRLARTPCGCTTCNCEPCACASGKCGIAGRRPEARRARPARGDHASSKRAVGRIVPIAATLVAISAQPMTAQMSSQDGAGNSAAISLTQTRPLGALGANIGSGYGVFGAFLFPLDRRGLLSLRADLGIAEYGNDSRRTPFSSTVGGRVEVDVQTTNAVVPGSIGIQLTPTLGSVEPYINVGVGAQAFFTESSVQPIAGGSMLASTTNHSDFAFAWTLGGGVYVPVTSRLPNVMLDVSVQYFQGARAEYLAAGSIADLDGGRIAITPMESTTHVLALRLGARIRL
jgi:opacity protein-like surface antigen